MTTTSQTPFLSEVAAAPIGPAIPSPVRAYFAQRLRLRVFNFILERFLAAQERGLTKAHLSRRIGKTPDLINRWLGVPSNLTIDTISDLLLGIAGEELELSSSSPLNHTQHNYSHFNFLLTSMNKQEPVKTQDETATSLAAVQGSVSDYAKQPHLTLAAAQ